MPSGDPVACAKWHLLNARASPNLLRAPLNLSGSQVRTEDRACVSTTARRGGASNAGDPQPQHRHRKSLSAPEGRSNLMRMWTRPSLRKRQHKALLQLSLSELRHEALGLGKLRPSLCGGASGGLASRRSFICPRSLRRLDRRHVRALVKTRMQLHPRRRPCKSNPKPASKFRRARGYPAAYARR